MKNGTPGCPRAATARFGPPYAGSHDFRMRAQFQGKEVTDFPQASSSRRLVSRRWRKGRARRPAGMKNETPGCPCDAAARRNPQRWRPAQVAPLAARHCAVAAGRRRAEKTFLQSPFHDPPAVWNKSRITASAAPVSPGPFRRAPADTRRLQGDRGKPSELSTSSTSPAPPRPFLPRQGRCPPSNPCDSRTCRDFRELHPRCGPADRAGAARRLG